jgi:hypothetical protein
MFIATSKTFTAVDAIIVTDKFIITLQVASAYTQRDSFVDIKNFPPRGIRKNCRLCHVFTTDDNGKARYQTLSDLPRGIHVYSGIDVSRSEITLEHMGAFDEMKVSGLWLHAMGTCLGGNQQRARENSMDVDDE